MKLNQELDDDIKKLKEVFEIECAKIAAKKEKLLEAEQQLKNNQTKTMHRNQWLRE